MMVPSARSIAEIYIYLELHPCECGNPDFDVTTVSGLKKTADGKHPVQYEIQCPACLRVREVTFASVGEAGHSLDPNAFGGDEPSQLIDAGEWWWIADRLADMVAAKRPFRRFRRRGKVELENLKTAVAALGEVLKFIPPGADAVPPSAIWTKRGREYLDKQGRFMYTQDQIESYRSMLTGIR